MKMVAGLNNENENGIPKITVKVCLTPFFIRKDLCLTKS
jgi:hypothetical protein